MRSEAVKRTIDVVGAACGLALTAPLLIGACVAVRIKLGSPVLFRQQRPGLHGRPFEILKLRTMRSALDAQGRPLPDAERLTALGKWLRAASIDELPELFNVLKGEMSLVGPRPLLMEYLPRYSREQARRHDVKPGLTGWAQIKGRNALSWEQKFALDTWYVENWTNELDLKIMLLTLWAVLKREGISHGAEATMPKFMGSNGAAAAAMVN